MNKIAFVTMDASQTGGIERSLSNLLPPLDGLQSYNVSLLSCFGNSKRAIFGYGDVPVVYLSAGRSDFISGSLIRKVIQYIILAVIIARLKLRRFDKIVSVYPVVTILLVLFHWRSGAKIYAWEHSQIDAHSELLRWLRKKMYPRLGGVIVLTERQREVSLDLNRNITIIPNGVSPLYVNHKQRQFEPWRIVGVGRLSQEKGFDRFIKVLEKLGHQRSDWVAEIFGDGPLREILNNKIELSGLSDRVFLRGVADNPQRIYGRADITAVTSRSEVFGMVIIESMSVGVPVIAYDAGEGPRDLIRNGIDGVLITDGDEDAFCLGLQKLMNEKSYYQQISDSGKTVSKRYEIDTIVMLWKDIFINE